MSSKQVAKETEEAHEGHHHHHHHHHHHYHHASKLLLDRISSRVKEHGNERKLTVVDVGCGGGELVLRLAEEGHNVTGIEVEPEQVEKLKSKAEGKENVRFAVGKGEEIPLENESVDVVIFSKSLHHVSMEEQKTALKEARRIVRNDGFVLVYEMPANGKYQEVANIVATHVDAREYAWNLVSSPKEFGFELKASADFEDKVRVESFDQMLEGFKKHHQEEGMIEKLEANEEKLREKFHQNAEEIKDEEGKVVGYELAQALQEGVLVPIQ